MKAAPILIIDRTGLIGESLYLKLSKEFPVIFVNKWKKFPIIADNKYSHILLIDDEVLDLEFLPAVIEKARSVNADFIFVQRLSSKGEYFARKILTLYSSSKVVLYGDVFDKNVIHNHRTFSSVINKFIYQAQNFERIQIVGDGLKEAYPVYIEDAVKGLVDIVFGLEKPHSLFYLFPKHPPTELSLAHMIHRVNPQIKVDFMKHDVKSERVSYPKGGKYLLDSKYPLAKKIREVNIEKNLPDNKEVKDQEERIGEEKRKKSFPFFIVWILMVLIFSPLIFTMFFSFLGLNTLYYVKGEIDKGSFARIKSALHVSQTFFYIAQRTSKVLVFQANIVGRKDNLKRMTEDIDLGYKISSGLLQGFDSQNYFSSVISGKSKNPVEDFTKGQNDLKSAIVIFEKAKAEGKIPQSFLKKIKNLDPLIKFSSNMIDVLPEIFGMEGQKKYLVLFQNNMELRPGGGFIGSYGILKLNMGKIEDFSIHDVYDADGQLRGHVEPPFAIRRHLPSVHWYLRDSNFDVDFVKSALSSTNFLLAETGEKVSGVIGVDVSFVKNILQAIGPVDVVDYKRRVNENNLYILTQEHSEKNFFPGSTQKKDFLRSLYKAILAKVLTDDISYFSIAQAISDSLLQKHLVFALNNNLQNIFTVNGWSSSIFDERKEGKEFINDFLGISEANLGVNKVNYFMKRTVFQKVTIRDGGNISEELTISYKNTSDSWPGGDYKNYLRLILPKDTEISEISINDVAQNIVNAITDPLIYESKNFKPPLGLEVEKTDQDSKTIYGFLVNIPIGELVKISIKYNLSKQVTSDLNSFSYNLKLFKQPGIDDLPYSFSLVYPSNLNIISASEEIFKGEGKAIYLKKIEADKDLNISFAKK